MQSHPSIKAQNLVKHFGKKLVLDNVSFEVKEGELFGFIGPDGAGKTTLFRIITTLLLAEKGSVSVEGLDVNKDYKKLRSIFGYMPGRFSLYQDLTVDENLRFFAGIFNTTPEENYHLIKDIYSQIEPFKNRKAGKLSGGMKQKLALSCALIHKPKVLVLDEPTTGVDAVSRIEFWEMLFRLKKTGITILVSTPYMDEASRCDRVALMQNGQIMNIDTPAQIVANFKPILYALSSKDMYQLKQDLNQFPDHRTSFAFGQQIHLTCHSHTNQTEHLTLWLKENNLVDFKISIIQPSIEDCFMELMTKTNFEATPK